MSIHFGTDGWRAVIGEEFTFDNVRRVGQAIADYLRESDVETKHAEDAPIVIGFDTRFLSDRFAIAVSEVLAGNDFHVILSRGLSDAGRFLCCVRAKSPRGDDDYGKPQCTAIQRHQSKSANGASASTSETKRVEEKLRVANPPKSRSYDDALKAGLIARTNFFPLYFKHIQDLVSLQTIGKGQWRVVVDPMYGAGRGYLRSILTAAGCEVLEIRGEMNPGFGGIHPEPIEKYLSSLAASVRDHHSDIGLATDGDADRIGAVDDAGNFIDPHFIFALTLRYLLEVRGLRGAVVKTVSTTQMINLLAERYNLPLYETPVGFNHIADLMQENDVLMGGEESGGITIRGHVPMGDGILMGLLLTEMMSHYGKSLSALVAEMREELGAFYYARRDLRTSPFSKNELVQRLKDDAPKSMAGLNLVSINDRDGVKYLFEDSSWLLIRPSGTEPVLRVYSEARSPQLVEDLLTQGVAMSAVMRNGEK